MRLSETARFTLGLEQAEDIINLDYTSPPKSVPLLRIAFQILG